MGYLRYDDADLASSLLDPASVVSDAEPDVPAWLFQDQDGGGGEAAAESGGTDWTLSNCCGTDEIIFLSLTAGYLVIIYFLWNTAVMKPMKLIAVFVHEMGHATACWMTCGSVKGIEVYGNEGGVTKYVGGWRWFIIPAGYVGGSFWGAFFVVLSGNRWASLAAACIFCLAMCVSMFFSPNKTMVCLNLGFIVLTVGFILVDLLALTPFLQFLTLFYGVFIGSFSMYDIYDDLITRTVEGSDAHACHKLIPCCLPRCVAILTSKTQRNSIPAGMPSTPLTELTNNVIVPTRGTSVVLKDAGSKVSKRQPNPLLTQIEEVQKLLHTLEDKRSDDIAEGGGLELEALTGQIEQRQAELDVLRARLPEKKSKKAAPNPTQAARKLKQERKAQERNEGGGKKAKKRRQKDGTNAREESTALVVKKMPGNVKYTDKQKRAILLELETSSISVPKLAEKYGRTGSTINNWRRAKDIAEGGGKKKKKRRISAEGRQVLSENGTKCATTVNTRNREETGGCVGVRTYNACRKGKKEIANDEQGRTYNMMVKFNRGGGIKVVDADLLLTLSGVKEYRHLREALKRVGLVLLDPKTGRECAKQGRAASWWTQPGANPVFFNVNWVPHLKDISQFSSRVGRTTQYDAEGKLLGAW